MSVPERYGGAGVEDFRFNLVIGEETQVAGVGSFGLGVTLHNDICLPYFLRYCTEEQRERWLPGICSGELITAIAMTEPGMGSDLAGLSTRARPDGDGYVVDGTKTFITNGINADLVITAVRTDPTEPHRGISLLVIERGMEGFDRGRNLEKVGQHRAVLLRRPRPAGEPPRRRGRGLSLPGLKPAPGAALDRRLGGGRGRGRSLVDARVRA